MLHKLNRQGMGKEKAGQHMQVNVGFLFKGITQIIQEVSNGKKADTSDWIL